MQILYIIARPFPHNEVKILWKRVSIATVFEVMLYLTHFRQIYKSEHGTLININKFVLNSKEISIVSCQYMMDNRKLFPLLCNSISGIFNKTTAFSLSFLVLSLHLTKRDPSISVELIY